MGRGQNKTWGVCGAGKAPGAAMHGTVEGAWASARAPPATGCPLLQTQAAMLPGAPLSAPAPRCAALRGGPCGRRPAPPGLLQLSLASHPVFLSPTPECRGGPRGRRLVLPAPHPPSLGVRGGDQLVLPAPPSPAEEGRVVTDSYCLLPADLREPAQLAAALEAAGLDASAPTLVLSECVLVYLKPEHRCGWAPVHAAGPCGRPRQPRLCPCWGVLPSGHACRCDAPDPAPLPTQNPTPTPPPTHPAAPWCAGWRSAWRAPPWWCTSRWEPPAQLLRCDSGRAGAAIS